MNFLFYPKSNTNNNNNNNTETSITLRRNTLRNNIEIKRCHTTDDDKDDSSTSISKTVLTPKSTITLRDTKPFTLKLTEAYVLSISSEYSLLVASKLPFIDSPLYRFIIKFRGINPPDNSGRKDEIGIANLFKEALTQIILNESITLSNITIQYGTGYIIADVYKENLHINDWILKNRFAVKDNYLSPDNWITYKLRGNNSY